HVERIRLKPAPPEGSEVEPVGITRLIVPVSGDGRVRPGQDKGHRSVVRPAGYHTDVAATTTAPPPRRRPLARPPTRPVHRKTLPASRTAPWSSTSRSEKPSRPARPGGAMQPPAPTRCSPRQPDGQRGG